MSKKPLRFSKLLPFLMLFIGLYLWTGSLGLLFPRLGLANLYGFLAVFFYFLSLFPSNGTMLLTIDRLSLSWRDSLLSCINQLRQYRRHVGVMCFGFSLAHGILVFSNHSFTWDESIQAIAMMPYYWHGIILMTLMTILALTSNNWCVKYLKKTWHFLHRLTYLMEFLLLYHILGAMKFQWSSFTSASVILSVTGLTFLCYRYSSGLLFSQAKIVANYRKQCRK